MKKVLIALTALLVVLSMAACRSRAKKTPAPVPVPAAEAPAPPQNVPPADRDFVAETPTDEFSSGDLDRINQLARDRGLIADAFFEFDSNTLTADAQSALTKSARFLSDRPEFGFLIEGHCDERGTEQYNLALGDRRANTAKSYLTTLGVDASRLRTISYGEERPFEKGSNASAWAQNRRAHLVITRIR